MRSVAFAFVALCSMLVSASDSGQEACDDENGALQTAQCLEGIAQQKRAVVEKLYVSSLNRIPEKTHDVRSARQQFQHEHAAWENYVAEHCQFYGGISEGDSVWISLAAVRCELTELDERINFLRNIPWNPEQYPSG